MATSSIIELVCFRSFLCLISRPREIFWRTVRDQSIISRWGHHPIFDRSILIASVPELGRVNPLTRSKRVVFPAPLWPTTAIISPEQIVKFTLLIAGSVLFGNFFTRFFPRISGFKILFLSNYVEDQFCRLA